MVRCCIDSSKLANPILLCLKKIFVRELESFVTVLLSQYISHIDMPLIWFLKYDLYLGTSETDIRDLINSLCDPRQSNPSQSPYQFFSTNSAFNQLHICLVVFLHVVSRVSCYGELTRELIEYLRRSALTLILRQGWFLFREPTK